MGKILVSGLINVETTLSVEGFPIPYHPVRYPFFGVDTTISGVGYNVAKALVTLGDEVDLLSLAGRDPAGRLVMRALLADRISAHYIRPALAHTPQSVVLYDGAGRRQINVDLKDIQEQSYPSDLFGRALADCDLAILCNINFSRPFLTQARTTGKLVATDVHAISDLDDPYNRDFMEAADLLFMSDENLPCTPEEWARQVIARYRPRVLVIGLGAAGALLSVPAASLLERLPAVTTRPVVNTVGAGDALFSGFVHFYRQHGDPRLALRQALVFASYKIGTTGAAAGFLDEEALTSWFDRVYAS